MDAAAQMPGRSLSADDPRLLVENDKELKPEPLDDDWASIGLNVETNAANIRRKIVSLSKLRTYNAGRSAAGISVLATVSWLGSEREKRINL
jgi:hypothetical protein